MEALIFDSHAHYDDEAFDADRDELLASLPNQGVCGIINAATNIQSIEDSIALAEKYPYIYAAAGIHPSDALGVPPDGMIRLGEYLKHNKVVAVGEIGLDYHYDDTPRPLQLRFFEEQLRLAVECDLPVIVHDREAHQDTMELLKKYRPKGVIHCFSGSVEMAREAVKLGLYIGLGGAVTFKKARHPLEVAADLPVERLLLETDAPYMTPEPFRGKRCNSALIALTAEKIAAVRGIPVQELLQITKQNAEKLFDI